MNYKLFHGTKMNCVNHILKKGFEIKTSDTHWMGRGVYFYNNPNMAYNFILRANRNNKRIKPAVIEAEVDVDTSNILNLVDDESDKQKFSNFIKTQEPTFANSIRIKKLDMSDEKERDKCLFLQKYALFDYFCHLNDIKLIICEHSTHPGNNTKMLLSSMNLNADYEIQYCVKELDVIKCVSI